MPDASIRVRRVTHKWAVVHSVGQNGTFRTVSHKKAREWDEYSKTDTSMPSDSDRESDYVTGLEDFPDGSTKTPPPRPRDILVCLSDPSHTSSFIQSILYEDTCAGVAVVDLFVAVKMVKDKMDFLTKCNNEVLSKITDLNRETVAIRAGYQNLMGNMLAFLDRINATPLPNETSDGRQPGERLSRRSSQTASLGHWRCDRERLARAEDDRTWGDGCHCCGRKDGQEKPSPGGSLGEEGTRGPQVCSQRRKGVDCLGCLLSIFGERAQSQPPILNEALLGSFFASLLWLQRGEEGFCPPCMTSKMASRGEEGTKKPEKSLGLSESNIQMVCDICEILCGTPAQRLELFPPSTWADPCEEPHGSARAIRDHRSPATGRPHCEEKHSTRPKSRDSSRSKEDAGSDGESVFEEALTDLATPPPPSDLRGRHNVTCMGDLSNEMSGKKNVSTFTASSDMAASWVGKLTDDIKTKLRRIKSKTNVTVVDRPYEKSRKTLQQLAGALEFAITASTPVGVFDVTVLRYRKCRRSKEPPGEAEGLGSKEPPKDRRLPTRTTDARGDDYLLEKDFDYCDTESGEGSSDSEDNTNVTSDDEFVSYQTVKKEEKLQKRMTVAGEDEMEEFLEIYVENSNRNDRPAATARQKATSKTAVSKLAMSPLFEIHKRYPVFFVQEMIRKTAVAGQPRWSDHGRSHCEQQIAPLSTGGRQQKEVVIRRSASDLVIYIQVEVEDSKRSSPGGVVVEYQTSSHGTQTREVREGFGAGEEKVIKLEEEQQDGESLYHIWRGYEAGSLGEAEERERITFEEPMMMIGEQEVEIKEEDLEKYEERVVSVKEPRGKTVTFGAVLSETSREREIEETYLEEEEEEDEEGGGGGGGGGGSVLGRGSATVVAMMNAKLRADIWLPQSEWTAVQRMQMVSPERSEVTSGAKFAKAVTISSFELEKALNLVREIENDVVDVKLSDAISILPQLESELRKHLQNKMKRIGERDPEKECSVDNFFSAVDFWPDEGPVPVDGGGSEERLDNLLKLLSDLEEAVRSNEYSSHGLALCEYSSSKIYKLLHALTASIRLLEDSPNVTSLSQTLDIASQLDTAVREYDSIIKKQPLDYVNPEKEGTLPRLKSSSQEDVLANQRLKGVRKKVFEIVEEEAIDMEGRIERDFDRLDRLEGENDEAMKFLEAFLQKTERRAAELDHLKADLNGLASSMSHMYEKTARARAEREKKLSESERCLRAPSKDTRRAGSEPVRETISGLLIALDSLKSRAREKNEVCREILSSVGFQQAVESEKSSRRSSRSSFTAKQVETMTSTVKDFKKIGTSSLYLSWTKPEGSPSVSVMGYEIHVNGTLNQKVRNPSRLQAVLYSVDLTKEADVNLYAMVDSGPKILLATVAYLDGEQPNQ